MPTLTCQQIERIIRLEGSDGSLSGEDLRRLDLSRFLASSGRPYQDELQSHFLRESPTSPAEANGVAPGFGPMWFSRLR